MKYCPKCQIVYSDDGLQFCLEDGNSLLHQTSEDWEVPTQVLGEVQTAVRPHPITNEWGQGQPTKITVLPPNPHQTNPSNLIIITSLVIFTVLGCSIGGWLFLSSFGSNERDSAKSNNQGKDTPTITPRIHRTPPPNEETKPRWQPVNNHASLNGERLTYYRGTTAEQCQLDCEQNPQCKAFALIRAGAYNPDDPPMCYLLSKVTEVVTHACCISAVKNY